MTSTLMAVELGFPFGGAAEAFVPLDWFGTEVTLAKRYRNKALAAADSETLTGSRADEEAWRSDIPCPGKKRDDVIVVASRTTSEPCQIVGMSGAHSVKTVAYEAGHQCCDVEMRHVMVGTGASSPTQAGAHACWACMASCHVWHDIAKMDILVEAFRPLLSLSKFGLLELDPLIGDGRQKMCDRIDPCAFLVA